MKKDEEKQDEKQESSGLDKFKQNLQQLGESSDNIGKILDVVKKVVGTESSNILNRVEKGTGYQEFNSFVLNHTVEHLYSQSDNNKSNREQQYAYILRHPKIADEIKSIIEGLKEALETEITANCVQCETRVWKKCYGSVYFVALGIERRKDADFGDLLQRFSFRHAICSFQMANDIYVFDRVKKNFFSSKSWTELVEKEHPITENDLLGAFQVISMQMAIPLQNTISYDLSIK